ncbi:transposase [Ruegeria atlantica]|uniref:transposase n=1 Tax=Ruegeria atlantica TaxID=81569 RepID=UPI00147CE01B
MTQSLIAGLAHDALIAPWVIKGTTCDPAFAAYIREVLAPEIEPVTAVILDNLATYRNKEAAQALRDHVCWFLYLPPYSPDLNLIKQAYSKLKAHLRRIGAGNFTEGFNAIGEICDPTECWNYFKAAGYAEVVRFV